MIAAIYARKSIEQNGADAAAKEEQMMNTGKKPKRRRARGSGSVYRLHRPSCPRPAKGCDCVWWISYRRPDGQRQAESSESHRKGDAERLLQRRVGARENNLPVIPRAEQLTFHDAAQAVIDDFKANGKRSLVVVQRRIEKHLLPYFGGRRLAGITAADVTAYIAHRQQQGIVRERDVPASDGTDRTERTAVRIAEVSNAEINRELQILKRIFNLAIESGRIAMKPKFKLLAEVAPRSGFFEAEQLTSVLAHLPAAIQPVIPHDLRRTAVRNFDRAGVSRTVAMGMVGHRTESIYNRYRIVSTGNLHDAARTIDRVVFTARQAGTARS